ncbi:MAG: hypothetical protein OJF50_001590 [Nitrospira sp.]|jgi:hypothetical protein|nr:hypothetical protein [Nitrospira sp.]
MTEEQASLVSASQLERLNILPKGTAYRMAKIGLIPSYAIGQKGRGVRFRVDEVLAALRRPVVAEKAVQQ